MLRQNITDSTLIGEDQLFDRFQEAVSLTSAQWQKIVAESSRLIAAMQTDSRPALIDQFLAEYSLSTDEGIQLMRLAEALSRTTDSITADELIRDKIMQRNWLSHCGPGHSLAMSLSGRLLYAVDHWLRWTDGKFNPLAAAGNAILRQSTRMAVRMLSSQFVLAGTLDGALRKARKYRRKGYLFSFDMLGEGARTAADAAGYYQGYCDAFDRIASAATASDPRANNGMSIKLSALHPRFEYAQADRAVDAIVALLVPLAIRAKAANVQITIDAEEAERLDISMDVLKKLVEHPELTGWRGLGFVVQAYQRRALPLLDWLEIQARKLGAPLAIRLVKGAYWDSEIKRAQEMGLLSYPVFTQKAMTDLSYLACARKLLAHPDSFSPQFATHNANSLAAVREMAGERTDFEYQRLFGMGQKLHDLLVKQGNIPSRIYAPVGSQKDLLSYLIRRLLENGANSSFVHQLNHADIEALTATPLQQLARRRQRKKDGIVAPRAYLNGRRLSAEGWDLSNQRDRDRFQSGLDETRDRTFTASPIISGASEASAELPVFNPAKKGAIVGHWISATGKQAENAMEAAHLAREQWQGRSVETRAAILETAANLLEERAGIFHYLAIHEAGKSWHDAIDEVREAVDFCRYYANRLRDTNFADRQPLGVVLCISPWNFPLAIFIGQITAALAAGNTVVAKPAEQTPLIAAEAIRLLHQAGVDSAALQFVPGNGPDIGETLVRHPRTAGICFTGSTKIAKRIAGSLATTGRPLTPLIAETGGINAMVMDASALPEQTVDAVISSAFQSAGQRCSALRILCVQEDIADAFLEQLAGAMDALEVGDPALLDIDIGPVIDDAARSGIVGHIDKLEQSARLIGRAKVRPDACGHFIAPVAFELGDFEDLDREIFGPVLHVIRFPAAEKMALVERINQSGYGLTLGIQSRIDHVSNKLAEAADVGNIYINRNQIGAVVGVQPFGGHGLSGTGPKAGGPLYLRRLSKADDPQMTPRQTLFQHKSPRKAISVASACDILRQSLAAQRIWAARPDKAQILSRVMPRLNPDLEARLSMELLQCQKLAPTSRLLESPAGETNRYATTGRGVILSALTDPVEIAICCLRALATGNGFVQCNSSFAISELDRLGDELARRTEQDGLLAQFALEKDQFEPLLALGHIDALLVSAASADAASYGSILAQREGPILPLLLPSDQTDRYVHEKTVTRNIAAAGGDVSLLNS